MNWIDDYCKMAAAATDAPEEYHWPTAMAIAGNALGRAVRVDLGGETLYPNLWVILVGASGDRKSTALKLGAKLLWQALPERETAVEFSDVGFLETLQEDPTRLFVFSEFGSQLALMKQTYAERLRNLLTDLYDCPTSYVRRIKGKQEVTIHWPFFTLLAAVSTPLLMENTSEADWTGGFLSRALMIYGERKKAYPLPPPVPPSERRRLAAFLRDEVASHDRVQFTLSPKALEVYKAFFSELDQPEGVDPNLLAAACRLPHHAVRVAMILACLDGRHTCQIEEQHMVEAVDRMKQVYNDSEMLMREISFTQDQAVMGRLRRIIRAAGSKGIGWREFTRKSQWWRAEELRQRVEHLAFTDQIKVTGSWPPRAGRPTQVYTPPTLIYNAEPEALQPRFSPRNLAQRQKRPTRKPTRTGVQGSKRRGKRPRKGAKRA